MKRTVKYALSAVLFTAIVVPAIAQSDTPFPDTKDNHWAYEAVTRLKGAGILVGYPSGEFIGGRIATRYEMAVAINAAYSKFKFLTDGLGKNIDEINSKITDMIGRPVLQQSDVDALKAAMNDLKDQTDGMKSYSQDITNLKRLVDHFQTDLTSIGADVDGMKGFLSSIGKRVDALEAHRLPIDFYGSFNTFSLNGYSNDHTYGIDFNGRPLGFGRGSMLGYPVGVNQDFTFMNEWLLGFKTTNPTGAKADVQLVASNMLGGINSVGFRTTFVTGLGTSGVGFGSQGTPMAGVAYGEAGESLYVQKAVISYDWQCSGLSGTGRAGRIPIMLGSYILRRPDYTPYFSDPRWDDGNYDVDGFSVSARMGGVRTRVFAARTSSATDTSGTPIQPMVAGRSFATASGVIPYGVTAPFAVVDQMLGANVVIPIGKARDFVSLSYLLLDGNTFSTDASFTGASNRIADYGGDAHLTFGPLSAWGGYSRTDVYQNTHTLLTSNNQRATGYLGYDGDKWGVSAGYRYIEPYFGAPGYWGRIGAWWNPTDIEGLDANAHVDLGSMLSAKGSFEYYTGTGKVTGGLSKNDKITRWTAGLNYKVGSSCSLDLGVEEDDWNLVGNTGTPHERWYSIGASHAFSDKTSASVTWQISDYNGANQPGFSLFGGSPFYGTGGSTLARGGLITTQFTVKF